MRLRRAVRSLGFQPQPAHHHHFQCKKKSSIAQRSVDIHATICYRLDTQPCVRIGSNAYLKLLMRNRHTEGPNPPPFRWKILIHFSSLEFADMSMTQVQEDRGDVGEQQLAGGPQIAAHTEDEDESMSEGEWSDDEELETKEKHALS